jgi:hypothetical protein
MAGGGELQDPRGRLLPSDLLVDELSHEVVDVGEVGVVTLAVGDLATHRDGGIVDAGLIAQGECRERDVDEDVAQAQELRDRRHRRRDVGRAGTVREQHLAHAKREVERSLDVLRLVHVPILGPSLNPDPHRRLCSADDCKQRPASGIGIKWCAGR